MSPQIISWMDIRAGEPALDPDDAMWRIHGCRVLAEGDSWFSLRGVPTSNLPLNLEFAKQTLLVSGASPGDTIRSMASIVDNHGLKRMLSKRHGYAWNAIFLSGGGNDLIDDAENIVVPAQGNGSNKAADYCDQPRLAATLESIVEGYRTIIETRDAADSSCPGVPVLIHTYDYATPRNAPARFIGFPVMGPWLYEAMRDANAEVPAAMWNAVGDYLIDRLAEALLDFGKTFKSRHVHVIDTRRSLVRAEPGTVVTSNDWADEIHPTQPGYKKIAKKLSAKFAKVSGCT